MTNISKTQSEPQIISLLGFTPEILKHSNFSWHSQQSTCVETHLPNQPVQYLSGNIGHFDDDNGGDIGRGGNGDGSSTPFLVNGSSAVILILGKGGNEYKSG